MVYYGKSVSKIVYYLLNKQERNNKENEKSK